MGIIIKPLVTEKMTAITDKLNRFGFVVRPEANKLEIKSEVEALYNVTVDDDSWSQILADNTESREISQDDTVMDALMQLDDDTRLIMQMYYYEGYSVKEISIMTKLKETSVYMRLSRGRKKMGKILSEQ